MSVKKELRTIVDDDDRVIGHDEVFLPETQEESTYLDRLDLETYEKYKREHPGEPATFEEFLHPG